MYWRSSSVPKYSILMESNWPLLRSTAWRHIFSKSWSMSHKSPKLCMSMFRHMAGSWQILSQEEHTRCALVSTSMAPIFDRIVDVTSAGNCVQSHDSCSAVPVLILLMLHPILKHKA